MMSKLSAGTYCAFVAAVLKAYDFGNMTKMFILKVKLSITDKNPIIDMITPAAIKKHLLLPIALGLTTY